MTTYYVDSAGSNTSPYDTWAKAANAIATPLALVAAGDTVYARGSETISTKITLSASGTLAGGMIKIIGCNSGGTPDGTQYTIDSGTSAIDSLDHGGHDYIHLENIKFTSTSGAGNGIALTASGADYWVVINCTFQNQTTHGVYDSGNMRYALWYRCQFLSNGAAGCYRPPNSAKYVGCNFSSNGTDGLEALSETNCVGCVFRDNTSEGIDGYTGLQLTNCVFDGNPVGISEGLGSYHNIIGCRFTNSSTRGVNLHSSNPVQGRVMHCYADDAFVNELDVKVNETSTNTESGTDSNDGYVDLTGNDFTLASGATGEDIEIVIDANNSMWTSSGLRREEPAGGGGGGGIKLAGPGGGLIG